MWPGSAFAISTGSVLHPLRLTMSMKPIRLTLIAALLSSSAGLHAQEAGSTVERCDKPLGTIAVTENPTTTAALSGYGLGSTAALLRIMIQNSNCFQVVERGAAMANLQEERALAANGDMQGGSNIG